MEDDQHRQNHSGSVPPSETADLAGEPPTKPVHMKRSGKGAPTSPGTIKTIPFTRIWLAGQSSFFERGKLDDAADDKHYLQRLNTVLAARTLRPSERYPDVVAATIDASGRVSKHGELLVFGRWILIDGKPGVKLSPGRQADPKVVLRTLAAALSVLRRHELNEATAGTDPAGKPLRITATGLAGEWNRMFEDAASVKDFPARLRSLRRAFNDFEIQLKAGAIAVGGKPVRRLPQIATVAAAIASGVARPAEGPLRASSAPPTASAGRATGTSAATAPEARLAPAVVPDEFEIVLRYASPSQEQIYRDRAPATLPVTRIRYSVEPLRPSTEGSTLLKGREHRLVLRPLVDLRRDYRVQALVDRMAILVTTRVKTDRKALQALLAKDTGATCFVVDRTLGSPSVKDWRARLPKPAPLLAAGRHFAVLIQEPDPQTLKVILSAIDSCYRIEGAVEPFLLEVSVDFRPRRDASPDEQIRLREQIVGLLQRHHWSRPSVLTEDPEIVPSTIDARQVYQGVTGGPTTLRYLFTRRPGTRRLSDSALDQPDVRERLLQTNTMHDLFLNATTYKGNHSEGAQVSVQHKVTDRVHPEKKTMQVLAANERRARIEVCFNGKRRISALGLEKVQDLSRLNFRSLRKDMLMFRLGTATTGDILRAIDEMRHRGIYGLELVTRVRQIEERHQKAARRGRGIKRFEDEGAGLVDWQEMNEAVGDALDVLTKRWRRFSWS